MRGGWEDKRLLTFSFPDKRRVFETSMSEVQNNFSSQPLAIPCDHAMPGEQLRRLMMYLFFEYPNIHDHVTQNENKNIDNNFLEHQVHSTTPKHQMIILLKKFQSFL